MNELFNSKRTYKHQPNRLKGVQLQLFIIVVIVGLVGFFIVSQTFNINSSNLFGSDGMKQRSKLAFLFLTKHSLTRNDLWQLFFDKIDRNYYNIYCHAKYPSKLRSMTQNRNNTILSSKHIIPKHIGMVNGDISTVEAINALLKHAYFDDPANTQFIILSDSHLPIYNFSYLYDLLTNKKTTWMMDLSEEMKNHININTYNQLLWSRWQQLDITQSDIETKNFIKFEEFSDVSPFIIFDKYSVQTIINYLSKIEITNYNYNYDENNKNNLIDFRFLFKNVFAADQHYHVTLLKYLNKNFVKNTFEMKPITCQSFVTRKANGQDNNDVNLQSFDYRPKIELIQTVSKQSIQQWREQGCLFVAKVTSSAYIEDSDWLVSNQDNKDNKDTQLE